MKPIRLLLLGAILNLLTACGPDTSRFTGRWRCINDAESFPGVFAVKQQGEGFILQSETRPDGGIPFSYNKERDVLTTTLGGNVTDLRYEKDTRHLIWSPQAPDGVGFGPQSAVFERVQ